MTSIVKRGAGRPAHAARQRKHAQRDVVVGGKRDDALRNALNNNQKGTTMSKEPTPRFTLIGRGKNVHVIRSKAWDLKHGQCQTLRKAIVADRIDYRKSNKGLSPEAALALNGCMNCGTEVVATRMLPAEEKRARAKDARDEVLDRAKGKKKASMPTWYRANDGRGWTTDIDQALKDDDGKVVESKRQAKAPAKGKAPAKSKSKTDKPATTRTPMKTKSGTRSVGSDAQSKAEALRAFCEENGWHATLGSDETTGHIVVIAHQGTMIINAFFIDGKYDVARHATIRAGDWVGTLRGAHAVRRQVDKSLDDRDRPHPAPGKGRSGPRKATKSDDADIPEDESPEDAAKRVPFSIDDDDIVIIDAIKGKAIRWRNGTTNSIEEAVVPSEVRPHRNKRAKRDVIKIVAHPKTGKRMLDFLSVAGVTEDGEAYGPERSVYLDRIVRVVG